MSDRSEAEALHACRIAAMHLLNALLSVGIQPDEIPTQWDALQLTWPTDWSYDAWCSWHALRLALRHAGWSEGSISHDQRSSWRSSARMSPDRPWPEDEDLRIELRQIGPALRDRDR